MHSCLVMRHFSNLMTQKFVSIISAILNLIVQYNETVRGHVVPKWDPVPPGRIIFNEGRKVGGCILSWKMTAKLEKL
jgi:hypothetical protein